MKQKTTFVTIVLVIALLCLGIAYAVISGVNLKITGQVVATAAEGNVKVKFTKVEKGADSKGTVTTSVGDGLTATFDVSGLTTQGDTATMIYTIENQSTDIAATLTKNEPTWTNTDWYNVTCTLSGTDLAKNSADTTADTQTATVTVTLLKTPVTEADANAAKDTTVSITINAAPVANN